VSPCESSPATGGPRWPVQRSRPSGTPASSAFDAKVVDPRVSSRGGIASSASRARRDSGTWRREAAVLPSSTRLAAGDGAPDVEHASASVYVAALERLPLLAPEAGPHGDIGSARYSGDSSALIASSSSVLKVRTARGDGCGLRPASLAGFLVM
jgi:hypothetical protein